MKSNPQDLNKISLLTLEHYNQRAEEFWKGTRHHDVSQNVDALLQHIEGKPPFTILDFGCGPGRDLKAFVERGHNAIGLEGAAWIPERSATRLRKADLNVLSKLGNQGLEWRLEPEAFTGGEVRREDDLLDFLVGCPVDIQVARQPST